MFQTIISTYLEKCNINEISLHNSDGPKTLAFKYIDHQENIKQGFRHFHCI